MHRLRLEQYVAPGLAAADAVASGEQPARARELFREAGYNGEPITILHATDHQYIAPAGLVLEPDSTTLLRAGLPTLLALVLIVMSVVFWSLFEQAGSSLNLFTDSSVDRRLLGYEVPASVFQSINAIYIVLLGPVFAGLWLFLGRRGLEPSSPAKFGLGVIQLGAGFLVLVAGSSAIAEGGMTPVLFIFLIYLLHTTGELCLSPVGLSAMNRLSPAHLASLIMGTWFLASAAGNFIGGLVNFATNSAFDFNGDMLSPSLISGFDMGQNTIDFTNLVPFDLAVPGNHEFDFGPANFFERMKASNYPWAAINITNADGSAIDGLGGVMV